MLTEKLKEQTREQHERLEAGNPLPSTTEEYIQQLKAYYGFVEPWERVLKQTLAPTDVILAGRLKTHWLEEDLDFFGIGQEERRELPRTPELPGAASRAAILGAAYVLEGSTLGGKIIARHLEDTLGLRNGHGYRYFQSYGPETGSHWQVFRSELMQASSTEHDPVIVRAACQTFEIIGRWFSHCRPVYS